MVSVANPKRRPLMFGTILLRLHVYPRGPHGSGPLEHLPIELVILHRTERPADGHRLPQQGQIWASSDPNLTPNDRT